MQDHNLLQKSAISRHEFKTGTWVPIEEGHARTNTKHGSCSKLSDQNETFLQEHMKTISSFQNQPQIDA